MKRDQLNDQYLDLVEKQRLYFKTVKDFKEVCVITLYRIIYIFIICTLAQVIWAKSRLLVDKSDDFLRRSYLDNRERMLRLENKVSYHMTKGHLNTVKVIGRIGMQFL